MLISSLYQKTYRRRELTLIYLLWYPEELTQLIAYHRQLINTIHLKHHQCTFPPPPPGISYSPCHCSRTQSGLSDQEPRFKQGQGPITLWEDISFCFLIPNFKCQHTSVRPRLGLLITPY